MIAEKLIEEYLNEIINYRRKLHSIPELGGKEFKTSEFIIEKLNEMGIEVKTGFAKTGIQGMIYGQGNKTIMIRADIDALPIQEENNIEYKSKHNGIMHACGHDIHTAILLGTAKILSKIKDKLKGNVKFCFQPAEETIGGADLMIKDGILENPKVDYVIGLHVEPNIKLGKISVEAGPITSYPDFFQIKLIGKGGHGSFPSVTIDPILPAVEIYNMLNLIYKKITPLNPNVLQICKFNAGNYDAIIPDEANLAGTVRTLYKEDRELIKNEIYKIVKNVSEIYGVKSEINYRGKTFPVLNNPKAVEYVREVIKEIFNNNFVVHKNFKLGGDDFCFYTKDIPATYLIIGSSNDSNETKYPLHNSKFNVDERVIELGIKSFVNITYNYLNENWNLI